MYSAWIFSSMFELHINIYSQIHIECIQSVWLLLNKDRSNVQFQVLKKEFPRGVDIIYESVGGETFDVCLNALAVYGRLIVIGMISQVYFWVLTGSGLCIHRFTICSPPLATRVGDTGYMKITPCFTREKITHFKTVGSWGADLHKVISDYRCLGIVQISSGGVNKHVSGLSCSTILNC